MKQIVNLRLILVGFCLFFSLLSIGYAQGESRTPTLFIGGGALPDSMYSEFLNLTGPETNLIVVPTASSRDIDEKKMKARWESRGFDQITILHTRDHDIANSDEFVAPLKTATAIWFSGGSQQRIADAYLGTKVEKELNALIKRGGVIGGSSAGAAIQTKIMISGGKEKPEISTGFDWLSNAIVDQHFLKRNRLPRLMEAIRDNPELIGLGIDEGTAIIVNNNQCRVVGPSYVIRIELINGVIKMDAYESGDFIPLKDSINENDY